MLEQLDEAAQARALGAQLEQILLQRRTEIDARGKLERELIAVWRRVVDVRFRDVREPAERRAGEVDLLARRRVVVKDWYEKLPLLFPTNLPPDRATYGRFDAGLDSGTDPYCRRPETPSKSPADSGRKHGPS